MRLSSDLLVGALIRRVEAEGGYATVLAKGDRYGGAILVVCAEKGEVSRVLERVLSIDGDYTWVPCGPENTPENPGAISEYLQRRRQRDPDLWIIELDIVQAERFVAETIL